MKLQIWNKKLQLRTPRFIRFLISEFQSLEIQLKLSIIIAAIVIAVVIIFSVPVLIQQEEVLTEKVRESSRFIASKLSQDVKNILLYEITEVDNPSGSVQEQLELLIRSEVKGLEFAFALNKKGKLIVKPDSFKTKLEFTGQEVAQLMQMARFTEKATGDYIEYYNPVQVRKNGEPITIGVVGLAFSISSIKGPIDATKKLIVYTAAIVIILFVLAIYFISQAMVTQIREIFNAVRQIRKGNLNIRLRSRSDDELGQLASEFNIMVNHLREKLEMQKFVSKLTVQMIQERGGKRMKLAEEGERHEITILFSDVRNFTTVAEQLEPEQIVKLINIYFQLQTDIIESYGGVVDKYMGDQIMAIFPTGQMLQSAISAAIEIQQGIKNLNDERRAQDEVILKVGIGINHGPAVLGNMGSSSRMDYTVIGDIVNIASRLCAIAESGQIIVGSSNWRHMNGKYSYTPLDPIIVKGRTTPVELCQIEYKNQGDVFMVKAD